MTAVLDQPRARAPRLNDAVQAEGWRCRLADRCADREATADPETGDPTGWVGAGLGSVDGLCRVDAARTRTAITQLPADVAHLDEMLAPTLEVRLSTDDTTDGGRGLHAPLPLATHPHAVRSYIAGLLADWAVLLVAEEIDDVDETSEWNPERLDRHGADVDACAAYLADQFDRLVAHEPASMRLRSVTDDPMDGWTAAARYGPRSWRWTPSLGWVDVDGVWELVDVDVPTDPADHVTRADDGDHLYYRPDGITAALQLAAIHEQVLGWSGHGRPRPEPVPCPDCRRRRLIRKHAAGLVVCDGCEHVMTDGQYDRYRRGGPTVIAPKTGGPRP